MTLMLLPLEPQHHVRSCVKYWMIFLLFMLTDPPEVMSQIIP